MTVWTWQGGDVLLSAALPRVPLMGVASLRRALKKSTSLTTLSRSR
ncbi:hypothetical protein [Saccharopolyspora elongata]|nr:hypothetical protein [Saccharopolyspora elongata]